VTYCLYCGHTQISAHLSRLIPLSRMRCDKILPQYYFDCNYEVYIPSRQEWQHNNILLNDDQMHCVLYVRRRKNLPYIFLVNVVQL